MSMLSSVHPHFQVTDLLSFINTMYVNILACMLCLLDLSDGPLSAYVPYLHFPTRFCLHWCATVTSTHYRGFILHYRFVEVCWTVVGSCAHFSVHCCAS